MSDIALRMDHVYKKFTRGDRHDSLRDLLPALAKRILRKGTGTVQLKEEEFWSLKDVSFEVRKGEAVAIIGHNGAGKSTMLKHLSGILRPTMGAVEVHGRLSALIEVGAGFHTDLTGRENVFLNGVILGMTRSEIRQKFDEIVEFASLQDFIDTPVKRYSSGMYARLGFSVAAHLNPDILVIDEVLGVGDNAFQQKSLNKMRSILNGGSTVIFVSHNLHAAAELCERALLLRKGEIVMDGPTSQIVQAYMDQAQAQRHAALNQEATIAEVRVLRDGTSRRDFTSGDRAEVQVDIKALRPLLGADCWLYVMNDQYERIFTASALQLGVENLKLDAGETCTLGFELDLHLAPGTYHVGIVVVRNESQVIDRFEPAATLTVMYSDRIKGVVNLYPRVTRCSPHR
jgi:lipopolysaccharide transport system ATP-binding protein